MGVVNSYLLSIERFVSSVNFALIRSTLMFAVLVSVPPTIAFITVGSPLTLLIIKLPDLAIVSAI